VESAKAYYLLSSMIEDENKRLDCLKRAASVYEEIKITDGYTAKVYHQLSKLSSSARIEEKKNIV